MKNKLILVALIMIMAVSIGIGAIFRQEDVSDRSASTEQIVPTEIISLSNQTPTSQFEASTVLSPEDTEEALAMDITRGELITAEIKTAISTPDQIQVQNDIEVSISKVVRKDTRAYIKLCIQSLTSPDPYIFGAFWLDYPGGKSINSIVHNENNSEDGAQCYILEIVSIPASTPSQGWKFSMDTVAFVAPQEGTECEVYLKRARMNAALNDAGIQYGCEKAQGYSSIKVVSAPINLTSSQAEDLLNRAMLGIVDGPWEFSFNAVDLPYTSRYRIFHDRRMVISPVKFYLHRNENPPTVGKNRHQ